MWVIVRHRVGNLYCGVLDSNPGRSDGLSLRPGQTYIREALLVADHNAYHVGQLVAVRRLLGIWR